MKKKKLKKHLKLDRSWYCFKLNKYDSSFSGCYDPGWDPWGLSVWSLHVLSRYSGFLPPPKRMHVMLIDDSKLSLGVTVSVDGCLFRLSLCGP